MRYLMSIMSTPETEAADYEVGAEVYEEMGKYNEEMIRAGVLLAGEGLAPTSAGAEVIFSDGEATVLDGPFTEAKEFIAGYWVLQVSSHAEALEWAKRCPHPAKGDPTELKLQLRRIAELEDLEGMPEEVKEHERERRAQEESRNG
ncbi:MULTISPECIES: YciI family protein [unclassified Nocardiopsis]|uniref:YciI family protein n=1 Tax=unclassified Nocardiopsis TaxID=2649073 RepID=UPI00066EC3B2|nr:MULTISPECIES: YciI family protein [unclassified Nocardiopsis]MBQ1082108.1 YciI family protein [Nocardiopsis sp. B62]